MRRFLLFCLMLLSTSVLALNLELTEGVNKAFPIGLDGFGDGADARGLARIIDGDLRLSGQFKLVPPPRLSSGKAPLSLWKQLGVDSVLSGYISEREHGKVSVHVELLDVATKGRPLILKDFEVDKSQLQALGHHISDEVYEAITGMKGVFSTKIAYILVQQYRDKRSYSLEISDMDGQNPHALVTSTAPLMSPSWSPDGSKIAYVSFEKKRAQIYIISVETGKRQLVTDFAGINGAPAWAPDGKSLAVVLSKNGAPKIYSVELESGQMKQLTYGSAIDTEPRYTKDGHSLVFTSGRGGSPQVYRLNLIDGKIMRLTFDGSYNARPSYTPDQKNLVVLHRDEKRFMIGVQASNDEHVMVLTEGAADESPSVAPNGRFIIYATRRDDQGRLGLVSIDGVVHKLYPARRGDIQEPAWSPYFG